MARSRNIKPGFFYNETLAECSPLTRLLFAGLWCLADRSGRLEDRPKRIRAEILPYDDGNVDAMLDELHHAGFIDRYQFGEQRFIQVLNFEKHQNPHHREAKSTIPEPSKSGESTVQEQGKPRASLGLSPDKPGTSPELAVLIPDSLNLIPDSGFPSSDAGASVVASNSLPTCPHREIIAIYSSTLPELSQPRMWEGARQTNLAARWRWVLDDLKKKGKPHDREAGLAFFLRMFEYIAKCDLLMGRNDRGWSCSLPWIVEAKNFAKIIEGNYENREAA
ncbi:MAG: hypothetical protein L6Q55_03540 [Azonexus sp.]|nr:hypothetical protein [Azonexus sp.]MCK6411479.1 hypothetical protein [Azonexus sp.]